MSVVPEPELFYLDIIFSLLDFCPNGSQFLASKNPVPLELPHFHPFSSRYFWGWLAWTLTVPTGIFVPKAPCLALLDLGACCGFPWPHVWEPQGKDGWDIDSTRPLGRWTVCFLLKHLWFCFLDLYRRGHEVWEVYEKCVLFLLCCGSINEITKCIKCPNAFVGSGLKRSWTGAVRIVLQNVIELLLMAERAEILHPDMYEFLPNKSSGTSYLPPGTNHGEFNQNQGSEYPEILGCVFTLFTEATQESLHHFAAPSSRRAGGVRDQKTYLSPSSTLV